MDPINWHSFFFLLFALVTCVFAVAVVLANNVVRMAFYLILSLGAVAGLFFLAGADFVGGLQLMIYVGGTLVLLVFGVMLTAQGPFANLKVGGVQWILSAILAAALLFMLLSAVLRVDDWTSRKVAQAGLPATAAPTAAPLGLGMMGVRVDQLDQKDERLRSGMSGYLLPFEIVSVHLLVVLVGAAYLARAKRRVPVRTKNEESLESGKSRKREGKPAVLP
jgi:NADH:ubiquinone oxidoreductase subunit 6 (subunit J)